LRRRFRGATEDLGDGPARCRFVIRHALRFNEKFSAVLDKSRPAVRRSVNLPTAPTQSPPRSFSILPIFNLPSPTLSLPPRALNYQQLVTPVAAASEGGSLLNLSPLT
jgi:hypothetical protein